MSLHPQCKAFLDMLAAGGGPPIEQLPLAEARNVPKLLIELGGPEEAVAQVDDRLVPGPVQPIRVRVYRPAAGTLPATVFYHGGGWVICDLDSHDRQCRSLANASHSVVIAVDYRLAPEHVFPAAPEDAYAVTRYVAEHASEFGIDPGRIAVAGDSAGGNLAAVVALMARDRGGPSLRFQLLIYPVTDFDDDSPSMREFAEGHFLTSGFIDWCYGSYIPSRGQRRNAYASPMNAHDLRGLPPAMIITGECDPLRDQGEKYAEKLRQAGVAVELKRYEGMIHPFFSLGGIIDGGRVAMADAASALQRALAAAAPAGV